MRNGDFGDKQMIIKKLSDNKKLLKVIDRLHKDPWPVFLGEDLFAAFKRCAKIHGYSSLILPVRPTLKSQYPTIPMENYINWEKDGLPFDPWLRVHVKLGGKILKIANPSMVVEGTVADWQKWTGMYFGDSGNYIVRGALNPVNIDLKKDIGKYIEPNIWVSHKC